MSNSNSFEQQVLEPVLLNINCFSDKNAFYINEVFYTYKQFGDSISKIRSVIKEFGQDTIYIGLVANDDLETYASIFALWLEGKAYIPLHPYQPFDRCEEIIKEMNIKTILDSSPASRYLNYHAINTNFLSYADDFLVDYVNIDEDNIVYVLFTSGSTGKPKGVTISRKNIAAFMDSFWDCGIVITENDRCLQCFDLTFDVSVQSFLVPLIKGACVYTIPHNEIKYSYASGLMEDHRLTFGAMAPSMLRYLRQYFEEINLPDMKYCILTAEASPLDLVEEWSACIPNAEIYDFYGPTEATIYCTFYKISRNSKNKTLNGMLSIGNPMKNVNAIIVDENNLILAKGEKGELCISGNHISAGYWASPEKNAKAFFEKQYNGTTHRFYHTGDLCYYDDENVLLLSGRLDSQAKIQGYRVELGEIEFHAREYLAGDNAVVLTFSNLNENSELALFIESKEINPTLLLNYLKTKLPSYMIPTKIIMEREFPLNSNGKVDKNRLKEQIKK